ncbi:hypothetical protein FRC01_000315 [Tulasnella sp. 417]|nr:hypothetical protein FRC01_000315 [Tulasnella sp. 417]
MDPTIVALQDMILVLCYRLKSRDPSLELDNALRSIRNSSTPEFSGLALATESVLEEVRNECNEAIVAAREQYNARLPVNTLPPELLGSIFQLGLEDYEWYTAGNHPALISLVCRQWNRVAVNTPSLWARWCDNDGPKRLERGRILSKSMGLSLFSEFTGDTISEQLTAEVGRWQDVSFSFWGDPYQRLSHLQRLGSQNAPKLRKLFISGGYFTNSNQALDLFDPHDPCGLEDLSLFDVPVVGDGLKFERLRRLSIGDLSFTNLSTAALLRIFEWNWRLEHLSLWDLKLGPETLEPSTISQPIHMDSLLSLGIICENNSADGLVRMMRFPRCEEINIRRITVSDADSVYSLSHLVEATRASIAVEKTKLSVGYCNFEISTDAELKAPLEDFGSLEVRIDIDSGEPELALSELINLSTTALAASPAVTLLLKDNFSYGCTMHVISALAPLRSITSLEFLGGTPNNGGDVCNPLDCLAHVMQQVQDAFPRLDTLKCFINTVSELESLRRVVLCRHQVIAGQEEAEILPLKEVDVGHEKDCDLQSRCVALFDEIQTLIPGGNLKVLSQRWGTGRPAWNRNWRTDSLNG